VFRNQHRDPESGPPPKSNQLSSTSMLMSIYITAHRR